MIWDGPWAEVEYAMQELDWYGSRKMDLAKCSYDGTPWAETFEQDMKELREAIMAARRADSAGAESK